MYKRQKETGTAVFLVGHVTKEGGIAGPRVLEHMVDAVLYFEGDSGSRFRVLRAFKNRFGAVNELGVFAMSDGGLREVANPSAIFLSGSGKPVSYTHLDVYKRQQWDNTHYYAYAYGFRLADVDGQWTVSHTGTLGGMYSMICLLYTSRCV